MLIISQSHLSFRSQILAAVTSSQLVPIADQMLSAINILLDAEIRNNDKLMISSKQLEIDVARVMVNLDVAKKREQEIFRFLEELKQQLFYTDSLVSSFRRVLWPLGGELSQISIYRRTIDDQLDLIYFHCFNITSISTV